MEQTHPSRGEIGTLFEQRGMRWTIQRQLILQIVQQHSGHLTIDDIHQEVSRTFPSLNRTTIYRTLETLRELGLVVQVNSQDDLRRYEMVSPKPHYHALCENCGADVEVDNAEVDQIRAEIAAKYGIKLQMEHFLGMTYCAHCKAENQ